MSTKPISDERFERTLQHFLEGEAERALATSPPPDVTLDWIHGLDRDTPLAMPAASRRLLLASVVLLLALTVGTALAVGTGLLRLPWQESELLPVPNASSEPSMRAGFAQATPPETPPATPFSTEVRADLEAARLATEKYRDIDVAQADGFRFDYQCQSGTGAHWVQLDWLEDPAIDLARPEVLMYDGNLELVGIEYMVRVRDYPDAPPDLFGFAMDGPFTFRTPAAQFPSWWRHVWLYRSNLDGMFAPENYSVRC